MADDTQDLPGLGTFGRASKARPPAPLPPARNTLSDLMQYVDDSRAMYNKQSPVADYTNAAMPSLGALLGITMPAVGGGMRQGPRPSPDPRQLMEQHIQKVQGLANKPLTEGMGPLRGQGRALQSLFEHPIEPIQAMSPKQGYMENVANSRIDRINQGNAQFGMPPIPYEGLPGQFTQQPHLMRRMMKAGQPKGNEQQIINDLLSGLNP